MATIKKKASQNEQNIVDLVAELKKLKPRVESKENIEAKKKNIETFKKINKRVSARISYIKKKIEDSSPTDITMLPYYEELENFKRKGRASHKDRHGTIVTMTKYDISYMKNELNKAEGKDYYYIINDGFNKRYKIKRSKILQMEDSRFFINKLEKKVNETISKLEDKKGKDRIENKKLFILKEKLLAKIKFNKELIKYYDKDTEDLPEDFRMKVENAFDTDVEKDESAEKLMTVFIGDDNIEI